MDIVSYEHNAYLQVVRDSRPFWLTKMLKSYKMWVFLAATILLYCFCGYQLLKDDLLTLQDIDPNDYFDFSGDSTKKWFVDIKIGEVMREYRSYLENFDAEMELTNMHA